MEKKLYRVKKGRVIAGVAAGLAEYLDVDPTIIRLIFVVVLFASFALGAVVYLVAAIIIPERQDTDAAKEAQRPGDDGQEDESLKHTSSRGADRTRIFIGAVLLILGAIMLARQVFPWFYGRFFWPLVLVAAGGVLILRDWRR